MPRRPWTSEDAAVIAHAQRLLREHGNLYEARALGDCVETPSPLPVGEAYDKALVEATRRNGEALEGAQRTQATLRYFLAPNAIEKGLQPPTTAYEGDAGLDLRWCSKDALVIEPQDRAMVYTGIGFEIPTGWWGHIRSRTSMGKRGLIPVAQVVDSNFTGILTLCLANVGDKTIILEPLERCAQIVFLPHMGLADIERIEPEEVKKTERGAGAYGSSGKH